MFSQVNEIVEVEIGFLGHKVIPRKLVWRGREVKLNKVNLIHHTWEGRSKIYYFAVSDSTNYYKLKFDTDKLTWRLVEIYAE